MLLKIVAATSNRLADIIETLEQFDETGTSLILFNGSMLSLSELRSDFRKQLINRTVPHSLKIFQ